VSTFGTETETEAEIRSTSSSFVNIGPAIGLAWQWRIAGAASGRVKEQLQVKLEWFNCLLPLQ